MENFLITNWKVELTALKQNIAPENIINTELIHKIRVSIKKLRAYLKLSILICGKKEIKYLFNETDDLFSILGDHRNIEINRQKVDEITDKNESVRRSYLAWLQAMQDKLPTIPETFSHYDPGTLDQVTLAIQEATDDLDDEHLANKTSAIVFQELKKIKKRMGHFRHNAHRIRIDMKTIYYWLSIFPSNLAFSETEINILDKALQKLGDVQDDEVSLRFIRQFQKAVPGNQGSEIFKTAKKNLEKSKKQYIKKAHRKMEKFGFNSHRNLKFPTFHP